MDLKKFEYFRHVAELGSFTDAGKLLSVGQPTLSRQIGELETEFGEALFERNGRGVVLTEAGARLLEHVRGILKQIDRARQDLEDRRNGDSGEIALGLPPSLGHIVTVPLVKAFGELLPNSRLTTAEGLSAYGIEWLGNGRIDCALAYNASASGDLDVVPLHDDQLFLIAPPAERGNIRASVTLAQIANYPLIIQGRPHATRMAVETALARMGHHVQIAHEIECIPAIVDLVRQNYGYAIMSLNALRSSPWADHVLIKPILRPTLTFTLCLVTSARRPKSAFMRKAVQVIQDVVRQEIVKALALAHQRL